jgi:hypothetical protein
MLGVSIKSINYFVCRYTNCVNEAHFAGCFHAECRQAKRRGAFYKVLVSSEILKIP